MDERMAQNCQQRQKVYVIQLQAQRPTTMQETLFIALLAILAGSWLTHIIVCIAQGAWGFLIAGALFFPVAWIHGIGVWFGAW
jgi:uncharacterized membrane protein